MTVLEIIQPKLDKRRAGVAPNYERKHTCSTCRRPYLCPDRYDYPTCGPSDHCKAMGWEGESFICLPCAAKLNPEESAAWWEAHGVTETVAV